MSKYRILAVALAVLVPPGAVLPVTPSSSGSSRADVPAAAAAPLPDTRIAFTDERDGLEEVAFGGGGTTDGCSPPCPPPPFSTVEHEGEASAGGAGLAYVSTRESPDGDVYLHRGATATPSRITCDTPTDTATETHPVSRTIWLDDYHLTNVVAYASDAGGNWDIYVSFSPPFVIDIGRPAPGWSRNRGAAVQAGSAVVAPTACDSTWRTVNVTGTPGQDELWPSWTSEDDLVHSAAVPGALPDLAMVRLGWQRTVDEESDATTVDVGSTSLLTETPTVAETQPAAMVVPRAETSWVAFTTTATREDGSIAVLGLLAGGEVTEPRELFSLSDNLFVLPPQGSHAAWSSERDPGALAFTSTTADPYGDVWVADLDEVELGDGPIVTAPDNLRNVTRTSGVAESHPAWTDATATENDPERSVVVTRRSSGTFVQDPAASFGLRDGDVSDVLALDGGDRRVLVDERDGDGTPIDEAGPSYSPDGKQLVHARGGDELVVADADGTSPAVVVRAGEGEQVGDPVWSPDGRSIAYVRSSPLRAGGSEVWVHDLSTAESVRVSDGEHLDRHPTWSPDSRWIMVSRTVAWAEDREPRDGARRRSVGLGSSGPILWALDTTDPEGPGEVLDSCFDGCSVRGRSPAWSPDGKTVAYVFRGALRTVRMDPAGPGDFGWQVDDEFVVTGFRDGEPTESRAEIESADDPAWAPDGSEIAFAGQPTGQPDNRAIFAVTPDGTEWRLVTDDRGPDTEPAYRRTVRSGVVPARSDVAVRIVLDEATGYVGGQRVAQVRIRNHGPRTAQGVTLTATWPAGLVASVPVPGSAPAVPPLQPAPPCLAAGDPCPIGSLAPGALVVFEVAIATPAEGDHTIVAGVGSTTADPAAANDEDSVELPVLQPTIRLVPAVARPGQVVLAYGEDMPPGTEVVLSWSEGIGLPAPPSVVAADGTIRRSVLLVRRDQLGERVVTATSRTEEFTPVTGEILVVLRSMSPPDLVGRG